MAQQLSLLTYRDMITFSTTVADCLCEAGLEHIPTDTLAQVFTNLPVESDTSSKENDILASMFKRKRNFTVSPMNGGVFRITCTSHEAAVVFDTNIREGLSKLLDTMAVLESLR